jgi:hypothetical protein
MRGGKVLIVEDDNNLRELNAEYPFRGTRRQVPVEPTATTSVQHLGYRTWNYRRLGQMSDERIVDRT